MGRQSSNIARISPSSANNLCFFMDSKPTESETIDTTVEEFRKNKPKREAKRKEVKVIVATPLPADPPVPESKPDPPAPESKPELPAPESKPAPVFSIDAESIAGRVAELLYNRIAADEKETPPQKPKKSAPSKKKEVRISSPPAETKEEPPMPPPKKSFGWC